MARNNRTAMPAMPVPEEQSNFQSLGRGMSYTFQAAGQLSEFSYRGLWVLNMNMKGLQLGTLLDQQDEYADRIEASPSHIKQQCYLIQGYGNGA